MEIEINVGKEIVTLRGTDKGYFELCKTVQMVRDSETNIKEDVLVPYNFFGSLEGVFNQILKLRIASSDAKTLEELKVVIVRERTKLQDMFDGLVSETEPLEKIHKKEPTRRRRTVNTATKKEKTGTDQEDKNEPEKTSNRRRRKPRR